MNTKKHILTACDIASGQPIGFVQSVSYTNQTFKITQDANLAKTYASDAKLYAEIDDLTLYSGGKYVFLIS